MFKYLFGEDKKIALIREMLEQRMRTSGFDDLEYRLHIKQMSKLQLMETPEAAIIVIMETIINSQKARVFLPHIFVEIEKHRSRIGHEPELFKIALELAQENDELAVPNYINYRIQIEAPGRMNEEQFVNSFNTAAEFFFK